MKKEILTGLSALVFCNCAASTPTVVQESPPVCETVEQTNYVCPEGGNIMLGDHVPFQGYRYFVIGFDPECDGRPNHGLVYQFVNVADNNGNMHMVILYSPAGRWTDLNGDGDIQEEEIQMYNRQEQTQEPDTLNG